MRNRSAELEKACEALIGGDAIGCEAILEKFHHSVIRRPLSNSEQAPCAAQLERLRGLALAAGEGIAAARVWLNDLSKTTGALDVYDRSGRQLVATKLSGAPQRY